MTPAGEHRGMVFERSGGEEVFETGTERRESKRLKPVLLGPKGWKGVIWESDWNTDFPSPVWAETTKRGAGREDIFELVLFLRNEIIDRILVDRVELDCL